MKTYIHDGDIQYVVDGASIRISTKSKFRTGIIVILPKIEIFIGSLLTSFTRALDVSRLPIALNKTICKGQYETYNVIRLATGNIHEVTLATISIYSGVIVGANLNRELLGDKQFRQNVQLSAMHQLAVYGKDDGSKLYNSTKSVSFLTGVDRGDMIVSQTPRSIRVRLSYKNKYGLPVYYIFSMIEFNSYALTQISYDYNEIAKLLRNKEK